MIAAYGPLVFNVSDKSVRAFDNFTRSEDGRWTKHNVISRKPVSEFLGPDLGVVSFDMVFSASMGLNPRKELDRLVTMARDGVVHTFVIGGKRIGVHKWALHGVNESWEKVDNKGNVLRATASVSLEEYV